MATTTEAPKKKNRSDYVSSDFSVKSLELFFDLHEKGTEVKSEILFNRHEDKDTPLVLDGESLELKELLIDNKKIEKSAIKIQGNSMTIPSSFLPGKVFTVSTTVQIDPVLNSQLMGLYKSASVFCTQCEAEGFRRITYYLDRPDIMAPFKVTIKGDKKTCPVILSNGNKIESGDCKEDPNRHFAVFVDPFPKPCYLFALVAGELESIGCDFQTMNKRKVRIELYTEPADVGKLEWALQSVVEAMKWDEKAFGREYDLDTFNVVCVQDFNMGAMENKGLNVFNTALLLAHPTKSTDAEYQRILNVVGHEYFHNWTGNRVTCRDWFQLTLKEGLTVFRDQEFTATVASKSVKRIEDVLFMKSRQYAEDEGPMAHPIRPEAYIAMDNFYTATVYDKGAEVIRMYDTLLGTAGFRKGLDLYFERHDGQAVTCDDFRSAMADANNFDFTQFERWYKQIGTPEVTVVSQEYKNKAYTITLEQQLPKDKNTDFSPLHIPVAIGLLNKLTGKDMLTPPTKVLELKETRQTFTIEDVEAEPVLSILRGYSAPVKVVYTPSNEDLSFLMGHDSDDINRWQAGQSLSMKVVLNRVQKLRGVTEETAEKEISTLDPLPDYFLEAFKLSLKPLPDKSLQAYCLLLPDEDSIHLEMTHPIDYDAVFYGLKSVRKEISAKFEKHLIKMYEELSTSIEKEEDRKAEIGVNRCLNQELVGKRRLRNVILSFLVSQDDEKKVLKLLNNHYNTSTCMTDTLAAFKYACNYPTSADNQIPDNFYKYAEDDPLVIDKWFSMQALSERSDCFEVVKKKLLTHKDFNMKNPNRLRSLIFVFCRNHSKFHHISGQGYAFIKDTIIELDTLNPQMAARLTSNLINWRKTDHKRAEMLKNALNHIKKHPTLSPDTLEIVTTALGSE